MKSVALKDVKQFEIKEINEPVSDGNKVIVEVLKSGICGSDIHYWVLGQPKGLVMGHEFCGKVIDPGSRSDLKIGDRVTALPISPCGECEPCKNNNIQYCLKTWEQAIGLSLDNPGGLTSKIAVRPDMVIKIPDNVKDEEAALVEPLAVGLHAVNLANVNKNTKALVVGGGIIGLSSALFLKKQGVSYVAVSETNPARGNKAVELEVADEWFDALKEDTIGKLIEKNFDVVIDCCGNSPAVNSAITVTKPGGTIILAGVSMENINISSLIAVMHELTLKGAIGYTYDEFKSCIDLISNKEIEVSKFISDVVGLDEVQSAYERLTSGTDDAIKILVDPNK